MIIDERMSAFIDSLDSGNPAWLNEIEKYALDTQVPIIRRSMQSLLKFLLTYTKPKSILEVGTAIGFSALLMSEYAPADCHITTIEKYEKRIPIARENFDKYGKILSQEAINCDIVDVEDAKNLLKAIGYKDIMCIKENDVVYEREGLQLAIKDIKNGDKLIEVETEEDEKLNTIDKLIQKINKLDMPIYTDNYFVKKAEIELDKVLGR